MNLIVDTVQGDDNNIIVIGAHADGGKFFKFNISS